jgi:uncharacterized protein YlxW (UPF0749 family)
MKDNISNNVGELISQRLYDLRLNNSQFAKKLGITRPSVSVMLDQKVFRTNRLIQISQLLNYNFFRYIADQLDIADPPKQTVAVDSPQVAELQAEVSSLQAEVGRLKEETAYLKKIIDTFSTITQKAGK